MLAVRHDEDGGVFQIWLGQIWWSSMEKMIVRGDGQDGSARDAVQRKGSCGEPGRLAERGERRNVGGGAALDLASTARSSYCVGVGRG
ncbi:uncharacterized protein M6B38_115845 [Iris pallida]|uniref:Uncharacterized protein n=1 Tax=Iris pallida TaxID=29817 RepID=A0AAX6I4B4_IRIPA|nr:uncharacterized protein M6B38_339920 [Iris pallida]KAJ6848140.1 uncharacterized protein M6B38_115845 [Iris pallida]